MIYFLTGQNSFKLIEEKKKIVSSFVAQYGGFSIVSLDYASSLDTIRSALLNTSFLIDKKLVMIDEPSKNKELVDSLIDWLANIDSSTEVLIIDASVDKRTSWYKFLIQNTRVIACDVLTDYQIRKWIEDFVRVNQGTISSKSISILISSVGVDQHQLSNEIKKLLSYEKNINEESIELLVDPIPQDSIFSLLEALSGGDIAKTMDIYNSLSKSGIDSSEILAMLGWQIHILLLVKSSLSAKQTDIGLHPFVIEKNKNLARSISFSKLEQILQKIADSELLVKKDGLQATQVVNVLLYEIMKYLSRRATKVEL